MSLIEKYRPQTDANDANHANTHMDTDIQRANPVLIDANRADRHSGLASISKRLATSKPSRHKAISGISAISDSVGIESVNLHGQNYYQLKELAGDDWPECENDPEKLEAFARSVSIRKLREQGIKPDNYTQACRCKHCGPIWLWEDNWPDEVQACVWCFNRVSGIDIPRPELISCIYCKNFIANDYSPTAGMCGCEKGLIGKFAKAKHNCNQFQFNGNKS